MKILLHLAGFVAAGVIASVGFSGCAGTPARTVDSIKIEQTEPGLSAPGRQISFDKNSGGNFIKNAGAAVVPVAVSQDDLEDFSEKISDYKFFEMEREYGDIAPNSGSFAVTVRIGEISKTVTLHNLNNLVSAGDFQKLDAPSRLLEIIDEAFSWTNDEALKNDIHQYNMRIRDAALRNPMMFHHPNFHNW